MQFCRMENDKMFIDELEKHMTASSVTRDSDDPSFGAICHQFGETPRKLFFQTNTNCEGMPDRAQTLGETCSIVR